MSSSNADILPVKRSKTEARHSYNRLSRWYDLLAGGSVLFINWTHYLA